jgi:hypothetical protein
VTNPEDGGPEPDSPFGHLEEDNHARITRVLVEYVPEVFRLNRAIEQRTGYTSEIGRNMMVDVLAHLGTLASRRDLTAAEQATQLSKVEEHLRRAIIEHPEEVVRVRLADVRGLWSEYQRDAYTYREQGLLRGIPRHSELEELRSRIDLLMESARKAKPDETSWQESENAAADMTEAAAVAAELADKLEQSIGAARRLTDEKGRDAVATRRSRVSFVQWAVGILVAIGLAVGGYVVGTHHDSKPTKTTLLAPPTTQTPKPNP